LLLAKSLVKYCHVKYWHGRASSGIKRGEGSRCFAAIIRWLFCTPTMAAQGQQRAIPIEQVPLEHLQQARLELEEVILLLYC
jgi:hypothetical protein